jgi:hypothetical protein
MISLQLAETVMLDVFDEVALLLSGTGAAREWDDGLIRSLLRRLDRLRHRTLSALEGVSAGEPASRGEGPARVHPAAERFLRRGAPRGSRREPKVRPEKACLNEKGE